MRILNSWSNFFEDKIIVDKKVENGSHKFIDCYQIAFTLSKSKPLISSMVILFLHLTFWSWRCIHLNTQHSFTPCTSWLLYLTLTLENQKVITSLLFSRCDNGACWFRCQRSQSCPFCRDSLKRTNSGDLWIYTDTSDIVDVGTIFKENCKMLFLYIEKLPLIVPDPRYVFYDPLLRWRNCLQIFGK